MRIEEIIKNNKIDGYMTWRACRNWRLYRTNRRRLRIWSWRGPNRWASSRLSSRNLPLSQSDPTSFLRVALFALEMVVKDLYRKERERERDLVQKCTKVESERGEMTRIRESPDFDEVIQLDLGLLFMGLKSSSFDISTKPSPLRKASLLVLWRGCFAGCTLRTRENDG